MAEGGFQLDTPCTPQLLYELSKMDGAILLNNDGTRILFANRFLKPRSSIPSPGRGENTSTDMNLRRQVPPWAKFERLSDPTSTC